MSVSRRVALPALLLPLVFYSNVAGQSPADKVAVERNVEYGRAGDRPLLLDVVRPKEPGSTPLPVVVFIHGGGWRGGDKAGGLGRLLPLAATGNYFCVTVGYRLSGEAIWPAQVHDCKAAIRWLRANAEKYGIDPEKIGVWGSSAGGHLVNMLGTSGDVEELEGQCGSPGQSSRVSCVVAYCGPTDFLKITNSKGAAGGPKSPVALWLGGPVEEKRDLAAAASPVTYVSPDDPPFLLVHGTADTLVPIEQAEVLHAALGKAGVECTLLKMDGGGHGIGGAQVGRRVTMFFDKHLRGEDVEVSSEPIPVPSRPSRKAAGRPKG